MPVPFFHSVVITGANPDGSYNVWNPASGGATEIQPNDIASEKSTGGYSLIGVTKK